MKSTLYIKLLHTCSPSKVPSVMLTDKDGSFAAIIPLARRSMPDNTLVRFIIIIDVFFKEHYTILLNTGTYILTLPGV